MITTSHSAVRNRLTRAYLLLNRRIWNRLPASVHGSPSGRAYGRHLHAVVCNHAERFQNHSTFFLRNRPELELIRRLAACQLSQGRLSLTVLGCSKGAEVYSILWAIRSAYPELSVCTNALDISERIVAFAETGVYSLQSAFDMDADVLRDSREQMDDTWTDQPLSIFERLTDDEIVSMFEVANGRAFVRPWLKEGIKWFVGDAADPDLACSLGPQDIVVANRFLCHMNARDAENCLRNIGRLVKPGGHLIVSGVDLNVRSKVARELGWQPVSDLIREIHDGDASLHNGWPFEWWGLEPFCPDLPDWQLRYASVLQIGGV